MGGAAVQQREGVPDDWIPQAGEPAARVPRRQSIDIAPNHFDEEDLAQAQKHTFCA
jgi:hypothetical protein